MTEYGSAAATVTNGGFTSLLKISCHSAIAPKAGVSNHRASGNVKGRSAIAMVFILVK
jgi:hypothetical protein